MTLERTSFLSTFEQRFERGSPAIDMLHKDEYWSSSVPNENSGTCYTYDPPYDSDPGTAISMYMKFNMSTWDPSLQIFLHEPNGFYYSTEPVINTILLNMGDKRDIGHPRVTGKYFFLQSVVLL